MQAVKACFQKIVATVLAAKAKSKQATKASDSSAMAATQASMAFH